MSVTIRKINAKAKDPVTGELKEFGLFGSDALEVIETKKQEAVAAVTEEKDDFLAAIQVKGEEYLDAIEDKGETTLASIPNDYTELSNIINEISEESEIQTEVYEYTTLPLTLADDYSYTAVGVTIEENGQNIHVYGTATENRSFTIRDATTGSATYVLQAGKTYRLSGCPAGGGSNKYDVDLRESAGGNIFKADYGNGVEFTISETKTYYLHFRVAGGNTIDLMFVPIVEERTTTEKNVLTAKDIVARESRNAIRYDTSQNLTDSQKSTAITNLGLNNTIRRDVSRVFDQQQALATTSTWVDVDRYSTGSGDWTKVQLKVVDGWSTSGFERNDGTILYPMPNTDPLPASNAPMHKIIDVLKTWLNAGNNLVYGNYNTMYNDTCTNEIDCSTLVTALLNGITYENSRYVLGTNASNKLGDYLGDTLLYYASGVGWRRLLTDQMAQWFARHNRLFRVPQNAMRACAVLQPGDILFSGLLNPSEDVSKKYYQIVHCAMVLATYPLAGVVVVAQAGDSQPSATEINNENTVCKTSVVIINETTTTNGLYWVFARPNYGSTNSVSNKELIFDNEHIINPYFQLNCLINVDTGNLYYTKTWASTPEYYEVKTDDILHFTGVKVDSRYNSNYTGICYEYDKYKTYIKRSNVISGDVKVGETTKYVRFSFGHGESTGQTMTLLSVSDFSVKVLRESNPLKNKKVSIIGDSISTYDGWIPQGYAVYYPHGDVDDVNKTWWKQLLDMSGLKLCRNASWSGSGVCADLISRTDAYSGCSDQRISDLVNPETNEIPDIVLCYITTNDWARNNPVGEFTSTDELPGEVNITEISKGYAYMLYKIRYTYPSTDIFCLTSLHGRQHSNDHTYPFLNDNGESLHQVDHAIIEIAHIFGCKVIDLGLCGIHPWNIANYTVDSHLHPNFAGSSVIARFVYNELVKFYSV